ncbi:ROK family protein, partial [Akkermansia sp.]
TSIDYRGRLGHYGNRGSLEDYVGNREIAADARTLYASHGIDKAIVDCNPIALERAALAGDEVAAQVWRDLAVKLSCALMNCCYLLNPEAIIIGGGVAKAKTLLFEPLQEIMRTQLAAPLAESLTILPAQFGTEAGILGSAHLALNTHFGETFRV